MCDFGDRCRSTSLDELTFACSRKTRLLASEIRTVCSERTTVSLDNKEAEKGEPVY